ncbi:hypothetical protein ACFT7S_34545 [Streptomyces sp. NPDC057136]|uniref:hypothetical protein n=1 Tax=Streptomyces sp. NPDC057136 TaxID=3346029 RepID=UPI0036432F46
MSSAGTAPSAYRMDWPAPWKAPALNGITSSVTELVCRAELLASELTTNSVRYAKGRVTVGLHWLCPVLRVSVRDLSPDLPELRRPGVGRAAKAVAGW